MTAAPSGDAELAAALFALDPVGLGGIVVRAWPGPEREAWTAGLRARLAPGMPFGRVPPGIGDDRLLGGLDLAASLAAGRPVAERGVLAAHDGGVVLMPMAERLEPGLAARLAAVLDMGEAVVERDGVAARLPARVGLVLFDEGAEPEESAPEALRERLAFWVELTGPSASLPVIPAEAGTQVLAAPRPSHMIQTRGARGSNLGPRFRGDDWERRGEGAEKGHEVAGVTHAPAVVDILCAAAAAFGIDSLRAPLLALRAARAHAALHGRAEIGEEDVTVAVRLALVPRAVTLPAQATDEAEAPPPSPEEAPTPQEDASNAAQAPPPDADLLLAAVQAALPERLLERIVSDNRRAARAPRRSGAGAAAKSAKRGRPAGSRPGTLRPGDRLNVPETLRAAAPWQALRGVVAGAANARVAVRAQDFRIRRFVQRRESTTIFAVDASGSAALARLAEAKGAVELLLAKAYVTRAHVALIAFRGTGAEALLPPTRSLARARRSLADLPGGGGTPLASGLDAALALALAERARERTPLIVVLTDGRANVARDGSGGRAAAEADALAAATRIGEAGIGAAWLDASPRPQPGGDRFALAMGAVYAPLPYADAGAVSAVVEDIRGGGLRGGGGRA